jgi:hypothetical protein
MSMEKRVDLATHGGKTVAQRSNRRRTGLLLLFLPLSLLLLFLFGCPLYNPAAFLPSHADEIASIANKLTLQWNPPVSSASPITSYTISYRVHGDSSWHVLATGPASPQPSYTVLHSLVGNGSFDFAVSATDATGTTSPLHTSLDQSANPTSGWFITWGQ